MYENLLWIAALRERGDAFVRDMREDEAANRQSLAQLTLKMTAKRNCSTCIEDGRACEGFCDGGVG